MLYCGIKYWRIYQGDYLKVYSISFVAVSSLYWLVHLAFGTAACLYDDDLSRFEKFILSFINLFAAAEVFLIISNGACFRFERYGTFVRPNWFKRFAQNFCCLLMIAVDGFLWKALIPGRPHEDDFTSSFLKVNSE